MGYEYVRVCFLLSMYMYIGNSFFIAVPISSTGMKCKILNLGLFITVVVIHCYYK